MSSSLKNLARTVNKIAVAPENNIPLPKAGFFHSTEVVMILKNMKWLLAALRFSNPDWNKSELDRELDNIIELEEIMRKLNNLNGLGVVQNNHANLLRRMARRTKEKASHLLILAESHYESAIENARNVSNIKNAEVDSPERSNPAIQMTHLNIGNTNAKVLSRMLGLALVHMDQSLLDIDHNKLNKSIDIFRTVIEIYGKEDNWKGLAILGYLITSHKVCERSPAIFCELVENANLKSQKGLVEYLTFSGKLILSDYTAVCKLCYNIWWCGRDVNYILWPLLNIPQIPKVLLHTFALEVVNKQYQHPRTQGLAQADGVTRPGMDGEGETCSRVQVVASAPAFRVDTFEKMDGNEETFVSSGPSYERIQKIVDMHMSRQFTNSWQDQNSASKAILFVLDASGSMSGPRLRTCKDSIRNILENFTSYDDQVGIIAFAHSTKVLFDMMRVADKLQFMFERLEQLEVFGRTNFYDAMLEAVQKLSKVESGSKWIIALTDGADTGSFVDQDGSIARKIIEVKGLNVACITVGDLPAMSMKIIKNYVASSNKGMHVEASDTRKIADAFKQIAHVIDGGLNECL